MPRAEIGQVTAVSRSESLEGVEAQLDEVLLGLRRKVRGVRGSVVADANGLTVASDVRTGVSPATLAANVAQPEAPMRSQPMSRGIMVLLSTVARGP